jgi:type VI secretion system protein ImpL
MTAPRGRSLPDLPAQATVAWDAARLDQAIALGEVRKRFMAEAVPKFPPTARRSVESFVDGQLASLASDHAVEALSVSTRQDPPACRTLRPSMRRACAWPRSRPAVRTRRARPGRQPAHRRFARRHEPASAGRREPFALGAVFHPRRDFRWWQGEKSPLWQAFGVQDGAAMLQYLAQQYGRAETLGRQAEAYIGSMDAASSAGQMVQRWQAINRDLDRYRLKNPNSSLVGLEQFLVTLGPDLDRFNCTEKLTGKAPGSRPADYFGERHLQIHTALAARCNELRTRDQQDQWSQFSGSFNKLVAGRQPFTQAVIKDAPVADFEDVGQMLKTYDRVSKTLKDMQADAGRMATPGAPARRFVDQFERVKTFLSPLYPTEEGSVAGYDVVAEFRANQPAEVEGNKVIDWTLEMAARCCAGATRPRCCVGSPAHR